MTTAHAIAIVAVSAAVTVLLRFLPFILMRGKETPPYISYLGQVLPYAIMAMLVVYCLKDVSFVSYPHGIPEAAASLVVVLLHIWKRNTLLSIVGGTAVYMMIIHTFLL